MHRQRPTRAVLLLISVCSLVLSVDVRAQEAEALVAQLSGDAPAPRRSADQLALAYGQAVEHLLAQMTSTQGDARYRSQIALQYLAAHASRPGAEEERHQLSLVLGESAERSGLDPEIRHWVVLQLERMGKGESVVALEKCLATDDNHLRDYARRALEKNSDPTAVRALTQALAQARDPFWKAGLLNSLGQQGAESTLSAIVPLLGDVDAVVARAAAQALGAIGSEASLDALVNALKQSSPGLDSVIAQVLVGAASNAAPRDPGQATRLFQTVYDWAQQDSQGRRAAIAGAALNGLMTTRPAAGLKIVQEMAGDKDPSRTRQAVQAARSAASIEATWALAQKLPVLDPAAQTQILGLIEEKEALTSQEVLALVTDLLVTSPDEQVQLAAIGALARSEASPAVKTLFEVAAGPRSAKQEAALAALATMRGSAVRTILVEKCARGQSNARAVALGLLADRQDPGAKEILFDYSEEADFEISRAALQALTSIVDGRDAAALVEILVTSSEGRLRDEAAKTLRSALAKTRDPEAAAELLVERMQRAAAPELGLALMALLNAVGGDLALHTVTEATQSSDAAHADRAIRTLCAWPDAEACPALLQLAQDKNRSLAHHVLAIRGLVRLVRMAGGATDQEKVAFCLQVLDCARQIEGRRLAISALGTVPTRASTQSLLALAQDGDLRSEAALAALRIAETTRRSDRSAARALAGQVLELDVSADINQRARRIVERRRR